MLENSDQKIPSHPPLKEHISRSSHPTYDRIFAFARDQSTGLLFHRNDFPSLTFTTYEDLRYEKAEVIQDFFRNKKKLPPLLRLDIAVLLLF